MKWLRETVFFRNKETDEKVYNFKNNSKFPLTPMGVLAPRSAHARPSDRPPIDMSGKFLPHVSAESPSNISPNP